MGVTPPTTEAELLRRARRLAGLTVPELALRAGVTHLPDLRRHKGLVGQLVEGQLGATAGSAAAPDFPELGVELKTIPVDLDGKPRESTFVCTAPLQTALSGTWATSWVRHKLARVLWVPIVHAGPSPADRLIGTAALWTPDAAEDARLEADWQALADLLAHGELWHLSARHGKALQLRPKGASRQEHAWVADEHGQLVADMRRGFYLRPTFTRAVLARLLDAS